MKLQIKFNTTIRHPFGTSWMGYKWSIQNSITKYNINRMEDILCRFLCKNPEHCIEKDCEECEGTGGNNAECKECEGGGMDFDYIPHYCDYKPKLNNLINMLFFK